MKQYLSLVAIGVLTSLGACASKPPVEDHYYSLVLASANQAAVENNTEPTARLIVGPIQLANYLDQPGIPIQTGTSQIQTANHHLWAEPLDEAIAKVLVRDLARSASNLSVEREAGRWTDDGDCRLRVEFDKFHATTNSEVVSSGRFWVSSSTSASTTKQQFDLTRTLLTDGYAHSVEALRTSLRTIAEQAAEFISDQALCTDK